MTEHILKCLPAYFDAIHRGEKNFEVRRDDRGFQKGDVLVLRRMNEENLKHMVDTDLSGKARYEIRRTVTYILTGGQLGIEPGYVVMALENR